MTGLRVGQGFDLHRLAPGDGVTLGGVFIPCEFSIVAHSDGDVVCHALCDALLGALALGDIGDHFPDSDERWKDCDSLDLLRQVCAMVTEHGRSVVNVDCSIIAEVPRVAPFREQMRDMLAAALTVSRADVSIKATTHEGVDAIGRREAIAAQAVVLLCNRDEIA